MSLVRSPGVLNRRLARSFTVFTDPRKTLARHQPGLDGVAASAFRLSEAIDGRDRWGVWSALGDMGACVGLDVDAFPTRQTDFFSLKEHYYDLFLALGVSSLEHVKRAILGMAAALGVPTPRTFAA